MDDAVLRIPGISCAHCISTIKCELADLPGVLGVEADMSDKRITVRWQPPTTLDRIKSKLREIDYPAAD